MRATVALAALLGAGELSAAVLEDNHVEPCGRVSAIWAEKKKKAPKKTIHVPASLAYKCLKSVPLLTEPALALIDDMKPYLSWQSDYHFLKNPPQTYSYPAFDMMANLEKVRANVVSGKYSGEYDFQLDLYKQVFAPANDGHLFVGWDLLEKPFTYTRSPIPLVSISEDGYSLPVIKLRSDVIKDPKTAQVVTKINGIDAVKYIEDTIQTATDSQNPDAAYNNMFASKAKDPYEDSGEFISGGRDGYFYKGPTTSLTFSNGSTVEFENLAEVQRDWTGVTDGPSMYKKFCSPVEPGPPPAGDVISSNGKIPGYPKPVRATKDTTLSGYYLSGDGLDDVAVLAVTGFDVDSPREFQRTLEKFLRKAKADGKTKLVVDTQQNGGGLLHMAYEVFGQLFPRTTPSLNFRVRLSPGMLYMAEVMDKVLEHDDLSKEKNWDVLNLAATWINWRFDLNTKNKHFASFEEKFGPRDVTENKDEYSALSRIDVEDPLARGTAIGFGIDFSGHNSRANIPAYFKPEDILWLHDGSCGSSCVALVDLSRDIPGVKSVVFGGRPKQGPMQATGGTRGMMAIQWYHIQYRMGKIMEWTDKNTSFSNEEKNKIKTELERYNNYPMLRSTEAWLNLADTVYNEDAKDGIPSQFLYEPADCRLYWTAPMISDITEVWKAAARAGFHGGKCAAGGITRRAGSGRAAPVPRSESDHLVEERSGLEDDNDEEEPVRKPGLMAALYGMKSIKKKKGPTHE